jgi:hypothetical protein
MRLRVIVLLVVLSVFEANSIGQRLSLFNEKLRFDVSIKITLKEYHKNYKLLFHRS